MPSTYSYSLRFEMQFTGENVNVWGVRLNTVIARIDSSIAGWIDINLTESRSLTVSNTATDEARIAMLRFIGTGGFTATIPSVPKNYLVRNEAAAAIIISTGSGETVQVDPGDTVQILCDGVEVYQLGYGSIGLKDYIVQVAFAYNAGNLPGQPGNAGKFIKTDGTDANWASIQTTDISDFTTRREEIEDLAVAFAIAL